MPSACYFRTPESWKPSRGSNHNSKAFRFLSSSFPPGSGGSQLPRWSFPVTRCQLLSDLPEVETRVILNLAGSWHSSREDGESREPYPARGRW